MWNRFNSILHIEDIFQSKRSHFRQRAAPIFSSHFSRTAITDLHPNRCEDTSTVRHRELRQSPETNAFPDANFSPLFDNIWLRSAHPQVHAKQKNQALSPIFVIRYM